MFSGFMTNAWEVGTIVAIVAGVVGFFVVLRGAAFPAHAIPNGAFAGAAGANLIGRQPARRPRRLFRARGIGDRDARSTRQGRRRDGARAGDDAGARRRISQPEHAVRAGDLLAAVRRDPRGQHDGDPACRRARSGVRPRRGAALPTAHDHVACSRGCRGEGDLSLPRRAGVSARRGMRHDDDGAGRRRPAGLLV